MVNLKTGGQNNKFLEMLQSFQEKPYQLVLKEVTCQTNLNEFSFFLGIKNSIYTFDMAFLLSKVSEQISFTQVKDSISSQDRNYGQDRLDILNDECILIEVKKLALILVTFCHRI